MDPELLSIHYSDPIWIAIAFFCGLAIRAFGLPPMIGFLIAGFSLNALGAEGGDFLSALADLGVTLLLFSIGLKLKIKSLAKPEVWGVATLHMVLVSILVAGLMLLLSYTSLPLLSELNLTSALLIGFALSFSSTVFAVKVLDEMGANNARHGKTAIGILVVQDIAAVVFIAVSIGKVPSLWAIALIMLYPLRHVLHWVLNKAGHGELLILFGIALALIGADVFELVGIKGDIGALVFGMLLAHHPKANELAKALLGFKELFLVGFFLSVGLAAIPGWIEVLIGILLIVFLPIKVALYFGLFNLFHLRASTSWRTSLNLANYSEFGLIVGALAASSGWLQKEWLAVFAVVLSLSFMVSAPLVKIRDNLYRNLRPKLKRYERSKRLSGEENLNLAHVRLIVVGMGRIGTAFYDSMKSDFPDSLLGVEIDLEKAKKQIDEGRKVVIDDPSSPDFWNRAPDLLKGLEWVLLTLPTHQANLAAANQLKEIGYQGRLAATSKFPDEIDDLKAHGVDYTFNIYFEAGYGFANQLKEVIGD